MSKAHLTAISRTAMSTPVKYLVEHGLLRGDVLDYGCGKGVDARLLVKMGYPYRVEGYDPYYFPKMPTGKFHTIYNIYVLNVIDDTQEIIATVRQMQSMVARGGTLFIAVRRDLANLKGWTSKGTYQGFVELDLPVEYESRGKYILYRWDN